MSFKDLFYEEYDKNITISDLVKAKKEKGKYGKGKKKVQVTVQGKKGTYTRMQEVGSKEVMKEGKKQREIERKKKEKRERRKVKFNEQKHHKIQLKSKTGEKFEGFVSKKTGVLYNKEGKKINIRNVKTKKNIRKYIKEKNKE